MQIAEIFESIHGEVNGHHQGRICTFIRTSGCNLQCPYCDTPETQETNHNFEMALVDIFGKVDKLGNHYVCVTGGEPLIQKNIIELLSVLWGWGFKLSIETNGTIDITPYFRYVESFVIDYKLHAPDMMLPSNYNMLRKTDVIKFVIGSIEDFYKANEIVNLIDTKAIIAFSALQPDMPHITLAELLLKYKIKNALLSVQLHKLINMP